jgi:hypothetical protein
MPYRTDESFRDGSCSDRDVSPGRLSDLHRPSGLSGAGSDNNGLGIRTTMSSDIGRIPTITEPMVERRTTAGTHHHEDEAKDEPTAGRPRVRHLFTIAANKLGNAAHQKLDVSDYKDQKAHAFPEVPGEPLRNPAFGRVSEQYTVLREERSRAGSNYAPSIASNSGLEGGSTPPTHASPRPDTSPSRKPPKRKNTLEVPTPVHIHRRAESH